MGLDFEVDKFVGKVIYNMSEYMPSENLPILEDTLHKILENYRLTPLRNALNVSMSDQKKMEYFIITKRIGGRTDETIDQYIRACVNLRNFVNKNFEDITSSDIKYYLMTKKSENKWCDVTVENNILYLSSFYSFLYNEEFVTKNPMKKIQHVKTPYILKEPFTDKEIKKIKNYAKRNIRDITLVEFLLSTGVRVSEASNIKFCDIDFVNNKVKVYGKGRKERYVFFTETTKNYIQEYFKYRMNKENKEFKELVKRPLFASFKKNHETGDYEALQPDNIRDSLHKIQYKTGVMDVHPHKFRRTFATIALREGMTLEEVRLLLGHESCDTTLLYARLSDKKVEDHYKKVFDKKKRKKKEKEQVTNL